jgi:drug/metabolite transporter (DMT)-like permease
MVRRRSILIGYVSAILAAALFGSVSTISKPVLSTVNAVLLSSLVYLVSGLTFTPLTRGSKTEKTPKKYYHLLFITAIIGAVIAPTIFFIGLKQTTASDTAVLSNGETVFSILFAILLFKEKIGSIESVGIGLVLIGVFVVTTDLHFDTSLIKFNYGDILVIGATALWGLDNNISKIITRHIQVSKLIQLKSLIGGSISLLLVFLIGMPIKIHYSQIIPIILLGVFGFAFSLYLYLHGIKRIGVVKTSTLYSLSAMFGLIFAAIFLLERIGIYQVIAVAVMLIGVYLMYRNESGSKVRS